MKILLSGRFWLTGPVTLLLAIVSMLGMGLWFPKGAASVDNLIIPMFLFPLVWAALFFYAYLSQNQKHVFLLMLGLLVVHSLLFLTHFNVI